MGRQIALMGVIALVLSVARAQEQDYNEEKVPLAKVPASVLRTAEKEAPGVRFATVFQNQEKGHRLIGNRADGKTVAVRIDRDGKLITVETRANLTNAKVPKSVLSPVQREIRTKPQLAGFKPTRTSLVDQYDALKNENTSYYEFFGRAKTVYYAVEVEKGGKVRRVQDLLLHPNAFVQSQRLSVKALPPAVARGIAAAAPGIKLTRVVKESNSSSELGPEYRVFARGSGGRSVELRVMSNGNVHIIMTQVPLREVPRAVFDTLKQVAQEDKDLQGFQPTEARRMQLLALEDVAYLLYGKDATGTSVEVRVNTDGHTQVSPDPRADDEEAPPDPTAGEEAPSQGFAVLAARYGREESWIDVTDHVRGHITGDRLDFQPQNLPDPAFGSHKALVVLYSMGGNISLSTTQDDQAVELPPKESVTSVAEVPDQGFNVLVARYGTENRWADVTEPVSARVTNGRLEAKVAELNLPDPAPGVAKALAVAYSWKGKVGLLITHEFRPTSLPLEGPPLNSYRLETRNLEFPQVVSFTVFTPDGRQVVAGIEDGSIRMLDVTTGRETHRFDGHGKGRVAVAVSMSGALILSGGADKVLRLWDIKTDRARGIFRGHTDIIHRVALSPNGRLAASTAWDKTVRLWDLATEKEIRKFEGHTDFIDGLRFTPDSRQIVTGSWDATIRIWDVTNGREVHKYQGNHGKFGDVALSKDGRQILFSGEDGVMMRWEPASKRDPSESPTYVPAAWATSVHPDGRRLLLSDNNSAVFWDSKTARPIVRLERHTGRVLSLPISPDGRFAASASVDKSLRLWKLPDSGR